jgi:hypothetical protein
MQMHNRFLSINTRTANRRFSFKEALLPMLGAAYRLHHFRDVHTRMLHDVMTEVDCCLQNTDSQND